MCSADRRGYRAADTAVVRAVHQPDMTLPDRPVPAMDLGPDSEVAWLASVWATEPVAEAIRHASPDFSRQIDRLLSSTSVAERDVRRAALATARYVRRMQGRPTPLGLFAGVALATFGERTHIGWGTDHRGVARPDSGWLAGVITGIERDPEILPRLIVVANSSLMAWGDRVVVPHQPRDPRRPGAADPASPSAAMSDAVSGGKVLAQAAVEVSVRRTRLVAAVLQAAAAPTRVSGVVDAVVAVFPRADRSRVRGLVADLVSCRALVTSLWAPSTEPDALAHLITELRIASCAGLAVADELAGIAALLERHRQVPVARSGPIRVAAADQMRRWGSPGARHPVAVDLRLDAEVVLPPGVARDAERAAGLLARLSPAPHGSRELQGYHRRFYRRYGAGVLVPLLELVSGSGIGWPEGYPGTETPKPSRRRDRDEILLDRAQAAALDGRHEITLDEPLLGRLETVKATELHLPPHLEVALRIAAPTTAAVGAGRYRATVVSVSRAAGVLTGRFLPVLPPDQSARLSAALASLPAGAAGTIRAQLSFPPLDPSATHVTRTPRVLPYLVSLAECRDTTAADLSVATGRGAEAGGVLTAADLAVGCDSHRLYLAAPALGARVEAWALHALSLPLHTPPLARLITDLSRAQYTRIDDFDWGAAASLPFLPRLRSGRIVLAPARWRVRPEDLPVRSASGSEWREALTRFRARRRIPGRVQLVTGDWRLPLALDTGGGTGGDLELLREHLHAHRSATLVEDTSDDRWCGGRAHEIVIGVAATAPAGWPTLPRPTRHRVLRPDEPQTPAGSGMLLAHVYADLYHHNSLLAEHLPTLLTELDTPPRWWFLRYRDDGGDCLRLRLALPDPSPQAFATAAARVSAWADRLRRAGLVRELSYLTSWPQTGRWGTGTALTAAQAVFTADSAAVLTQLCQRGRAGDRALTAAQFVAITTAFTGSTTRAARWLLDHVPPTALAAVPRPVYAEAVRLAGPTDDFAALRATPAGVAIAEAWKDRSGALATYQALLPDDEAEHADTGQPDVAGLDPDIVLDALLHSHFLRAIGIDPAEKAICLYLARAAAHAVLARTTHTPPMPPGAGGCP